MKRALAIAALLSLTAIAPVEAMAAQQSPMARTTIGAFGPWELATMDKSCALIRIQGDVTLVLLGMPDKPLITISALLPRYRPELANQVISLSLEGKPAATLAIMPLPNQDQDTTTVIAVVESFDTVPPLPARLKFENEKKQALLDTLLDPSAEAVSAWRGCLATK